MLASLPMYDLPKLRAMTDRWWTGLAQHMRRAGIDGVPDALARDPQPAWTDPRLLFSQTCGYPLTHVLDGKVEVVCTPMHDAPGCTGAYYVSALVVAAGSTAGTLADLRGTACAFNSTDSQSGHNVLRRMVALLAGGESFFDRVIETGSHGASLAAVAAGEADLCAVDTITHALIERHEPERLNGTRVLERSPPAPGLPYIAGPAVPVEARQRMNAAVHAAMADPDLAETRAALLIKGAEDLSRADYEEIVAMEREAIEAGYPELR